MWTLNKFKDVLDNLMFVIYPNICLFYILHYHSTWKCKRPFKRNHSHRILLEKSKSTLQAYSYVLRINSFCQAQNKMQKVLNTKWSHQYVGVSKIFVEFGRPNVNKLSPSLGWPFHLLLLGWVYTKTHQKINITEAKAFNLTFRCIGDVLLYYWS